MSECGLGSGAIVADIASGTGIFTRMLLQNGAQVYAVEPNQEMRRAGEAALMGNPGFHSICGTAEATTLRDCSADLVTAAQAAHWFDLKKARDEFLRILKPGAFAVLLWNERQLDGSAFLREYEQLLLTYGVDYGEVRHELTTARIQEFFVPADCQLKVFHLSQQVDYAGLEGRLLSSSYTPRGGHPDYSPMLQELHRIYEAHQSQGKVTLEYDTRVYYGRLT
jgi:SAM-dependent methyltransferase